MSVAKVARRKWLRVLVGVLPQGEVQLRLGLEVPRLSAAHVDRKCVVPRSLEILGDGPATTRVTAADPDEVATSELRLSAIVGESITAVQNGHVVDEVNIARLSLDAQLDSVSDLLDKIEGPELLIRREWQFLVARVSLAANQRGAAKVDNKPSLMVENCRAALNLGNREGEGRCQGVDQFRMLRCQEIVNSVCGSDDAATTLGSLATGQPSNDVSVLIGVECLMQVHC